MNYKGKIGEFKPLGFVSWTIVFLIFGLFVYQRFTFVTVPPAQSQASTSAESETVKQLQVQVNELKAQLALLQKGGPPAIKATPHK